MAFTLNGIPLGDGFKAKRTSFGIGTLIFLLLFGAIFIGVSLLFIKDDFRSRGWPATDGVISSVRQSRDSDGNTMYTPTVSYTVNGENYTTTPSYSSSTNYTVGNKQTVHYNPATPSEGVLRTSGAGLLVYMFPIIGLAVIIVGIVSFVRDRRRSRQINALRTNGIKIQGVVTDVTSGGTNSRASVITVSATTPDGQVRHFQSDSVSGLSIVGLAEYQTKPVAIDVYIDPVNPGNYYVDLDDIPNITPERIASLLKSAAAPSPNPSVVTTPPINNTVQPSGTKPESKL